MVGGLSSASVREHRARGRERGLNPAPQQKSAHSRRRAANRFLVYFFIMIASATLLLAALAPALGQYAVTILEKGPVPAISSACAPLNHPA